jgi:hypothetical protein
VYCPRHIVAPALLLRSMHDQHHSSIRLRPGVSSLPWFPFGFGCFSVHLQTVVKPVAALLRHHHSGSAPVIIKERSTSSIGTSLTFGQRSIVFLRVRQHQSSRSRSCTKPNSAACSQQSTHPIRLTGRSTRTLQPRSGSSSGLRDFSSPPFIRLAAPPVNSKR